MGALTSKPYAFTTRPWELETRKFFDFFDAFTPKIVLYFRKNQLTRVTSLAKHFFKDFWISDKIRFAAFSVNFNRILSINLLINKKSLSSVYITVTNDLFKHYIAQNLHTTSERSQIDIITGSTLDLIQARNLSSISFNHHNKMIVNLNSARDHNFSGYFPVQRDFYFRDEDSFAELDAFLCIGVNIRKVSATFFNFLQQKAKTNLKVLATCLVNSNSANLQHSSKTKHVGGHMFQLVQFSKGSHLILNEVFATFKNNACCFAINLPLSNNTFLRNFFTFQFSPVATSLGQIVRLELGQYSDFYSLDRNYSKYKALDYNCTVLNKSNLKILYLLDVDNLCFDHSYYDFVIYRGVYWDNLSWCSDLVLPYWSILEFPNILTINAFGINSLYKQPMAIQTNLPTFLLFPTPKVSLNYSKSENEIKVDVVDVYDNISKQYIDDERYFTAKSVDYETSLKMVRIYTNKFQDVVAEDFFFNTAMCRSSSIFALRTKQTLVSTNNFRSLLS